MRADPAGGLLHRGRAQIRLRLAPSVARQRAEHHVISYSGGTGTNTADAVKVMEEDSANTNNVLCIYSGKSKTKSTFGVSGGWNREHCWYNSYGLDCVEPAYSDLHNLRAEDSNVNS